MAAELAIGAGALALVPGEPDELDRLAARLSVFADGMGDAARTLADVHAAGWRGPAADAFSGLVGEQPAKFRSAGSAFGEASGAIRGFASVLRRAQGDAGRAVTLFEDAHARSQSWQQERTAHDADVRAAQAAGDPPPAGPAPPASNPAAGDMAASRDLLADAREHVRAQGRLVASTLAAAAEHAPDEPGLLDSVVGGIGDALGGAGHALAAVWTAGSGALSDAGGWLKDVWDDFGPQLLEVAAGMIMVTVGVRLIVVAAGMEVVGVAANATGVGAVVGVPLNVGGIAVAGVGAILVVGGGVTIWDGISRMEDGGSDASSAEDGDAARDKRLEDLAKDPDTGYKSSEGSRKEADDALNLEKRGDVPEPVRRADGKVNDSERGADFVDGKGQKWDHKNATSEHGPFDQGKFLDKVQRGDIANDENIILNREGLNAKELSELVKEIERRGLSDNFKFWPPL